VTDRRPTCVVTTIQSPTPSLARLASTLALHEFSFVVVGDRKGPREFELDSCTLIDIDDQLRLGLRLSAQLPENHYVRKNLGYLVAIRDGAPYIYETDDDNAPLDSWSPRSLAAQAEPVEARPWANVYRIFDPQAVIWPRGFPLHLVQDAASFAHAPAEPIDLVAPVQQGLADGSPDVDAVWRLILNADYDFPKRPSIWLPPDTWCPFNSQSTWWWPAAYPLMYLPAFCSFRMTDIWRSFVAQRCLWAMGYGVVFHAAEVLQQRNDHNLMIDFEDEIPGYLGNTRMCETLGKTELTQGPDTAAVNLRACYKSLVSEGFLPDKELSLVDAWLEDLAEIGAH
jgi:hypothetical protein